MAQRRDRRYSEARRRAEAQGSTINQPKRAWRLQLVLRSTAYIVIVPHFEPLPRISPGGRLRILALILRRHFRKILIRHSFLTLILHSQRGRLDEALLTMESESLEVLLQALGQWTADSKMRSFLLPRDGDP